MITAIEILASLSPIVIIYLQLHHMAKEDRSTDSIKWHFGK